MSSLTSSQKGAVAEAEIVAAAAHLGLVVLRRCAASRRGDVLTVHCTTSRHTPQGYVRTRYSGEEVDALAVYSAETDRCYLLPIADVERRSVISLRLGPTANNQALNVRWARDYEIARSLRRHWNVDISDEGRDRLEAIQAVG